MEFFMRTVLRYAVIATGLSFSICHGQERQDDLNFRTSKLDGLRLYGVSVYSGYVSVAGPATEFGQGTGLNLTNLQGDTSYGAEWTAGWQHRREKLSASFRYSGTYNGQARYSNLNAFGHSAAFGFNKTIHNRWTVDVSATGDYRTLAQYLFQPTALSSLTQTPASFDDLAAAFSVGRFSDTQIASMLTLTPAPALSSPQTSLLLGDRVLTYDFHSTVTYQHSSRLSVSLSSFTAGGRNTLGDAPVFVLPRSIGATAGVNISYSVSPRTNLSLSVDENRSVNEFQDSYTTTANAGFGRKMGMHWFLSMNGGMALIHITKQVIGTPPARQVIGGGSIGYKLYTHTLAAIYERSAYDQYGLAGGNSLASGAWNWQRPGNAWNVHASLGQRKTDNLGFANLSGWQISTGVSRALSAQTMVSAEYVYFKSTGSYLDNMVDRSVHSVRVSFGWSPQVFPR
jgi:hypothetical protein